MKVLIIAGIAIICSAVILPIIAAVYAFKFFKGENIGGNFIKTVEIDTGFTGFEPVKVDIYKHWLLGRLYKYGNTTVPDEVAKVALAKASGIKNWEIMSS